ncbi:hypothetical protein [Halorubrum sp. DM2]|uniref:hypothetical protein n=1 Tax=Halorubrum sp. DM2 TaxID=2527867 RepID=UPI0024B6B702|nr:hypothetical protein [Halorubrum sp. DM2]
MTDANAGRRREAADDEREAASDVCESVPVAPMDVAPELFPASADGGEDATRASSDGRADLGRRDP